ncbi:MAG: hypothetical protein O7E57_11165 [Gammaproteobacteria bacterium]|nr:hypothetical protein [Gammaproteobacteria bacterium]
MPRAATLTFDQRNFSVRGDSGAAGAEPPAPISDVVVIVDVLSFTTSLDIALARGTVVFPCPWDHQQQG